ncbi:MAG TPA: heparan-alpha-glucosaminide N-acetyltransferase domain-containing protein [Candidatus Bilamarchaeum sp.]|nr:heparan-alpha-glucosaminide N-acetyltransferase domain-containing protein [Candidatus Bilamarchaeum sp.]
MRVRGIDVFRGFSILLMVFFTLILGLSSSLPDALSHNKEFSLHIGDFVLPMFLFASGMSLVFFREKIAHLNAVQRLFFVAERFCRIAAVWFFLSPFTSGEVFGMDELMLSAVLFIPAYVLAGFGDMVLAGASAACFAGYFILAGSGALPNFSAHYLGGFEGAAFYLPVMLGGVLAGRRLELLPQLLAASGIAAVALLLLSAPYKLSLTPSFMALSVFVSIAAYMTLERQRSGKLEFLGRDPLRYWVLMVVLVFVPLKVYAYYAGILLPLGMDWPVAILAAASVMAGLFLISLGLDRLVAAVMRLRKSAKADSP